MARSRTTRHGGYAVLAYHQVVEQTDGLRSGVMARTFREQLGMLRDAGEIVSVSELLRRWRRGDVPSGWVYALTFDDGYANLAEVAHPILVAEQVPAMVFLTTGFMDAPEDLPWWDQLRHFVARRSRTVNWDGRTYALHGAAAQAAFFKHVSRTVVHDYRRLAKLLEMLAMDAPSPVRNEFLDWPTVRTLLAQGLFEFAPHSVTHPVLRSCTNLAYEIEHSHARLREETGVAATVFAYPYGRPQHYCARVAAALLKAGFDTAFTTVYGHVSAQSAPLALPRINIGRQDSPRRFRARLRHPALFELGFKWRELRYGTAP